MLHLANGDSAAAALARAGLPGELATWADCLDQGPLQGAPGTRKFRALRAQFLGGAGVSDAREVEAQLERWDAPLLLRPDEVVCWFEADLTCQLALVHHLALRPCSLVMTAKPIPQHAPEELAALLPVRQQPTAAIIGLARAAWAAVSGPDPQAILSLLPEAFDPLPFLPRALLRLLEELPEPGSGLSRSERQMLEEGGSFAKAQAREEVPFLTDSFFALAWSGLEDAGLVADGKVTADGRASLARTLDYRARAQDRWVGGALLQGPRCFRWDRTRVLAP